MDEEFGVSTTIAEERKKTAPKKVCSVWLARIEALYGACPLFRMPCCRLLTHFVPFRLLKVKEDMDRKIWLAWPFSIRKKHCCKVKRPFWFCKIKVRSPFSRLIVPCENFYPFADVLDESDDVLVNPTISELEKWKKNAELRKKKPGYNPYDEELDEYGMVRLCLFHSRMAPLVW